MSEAKRPRRRTRWWFLGGFLLLGAVLIFYVRAVLAVEQPVKNVATFGSVVLTFLLLLVWLLFLSGLRWRMRLLSFAVVVGIPVGIGAVVGIDGFSGDMVPRFRWRWMPAKDVLLGEAVPVKESDAGTAEPIDLAAVTPRDYPRFLGADGRAVVEGLALDPDWTASPPRKLWRQPIGVGWSSFSIVGKYAVTQEQRGELEEVTCYEVATGRLRWTHQDRVRFCETMGGDGPRATPTVADDRVYALGATGVLNCLDGRTGAVVWSRDTLAEHRQKNLQWGKSASPLLVDNLVVVSLGKSAEPSLVAYDKQSGAPVWQAGNDKASYASPVLATLAGRRQILSVNAGSLSSHDPADGHLLWQYHWPGEQAKCSQPVPLEGDRVFISAGYGLGCTLLQVAADGDRFTATKVWSNSHLRTRFTNVVVTGGFVYGLDDGVLECVELSTGERKWRSGRYGHGQVLLVGRTLLVTAEFGDIALVDASPAAHRELARFPALTGKTWNNPAISGHYLLVRNDQEAACYQLPTRPAEAVASAPASE